MSATEMMLKYFKSKGVEVLNEMPDGWKESKGATTAPYGYVWINNGKSLFNREYEHALLKLK